MTNKTCVCYKKRESDNPIGITNIIIKILANADIKRDSGFDSPDFAELTTEIEADFGVDIFEDGIVFKISDILEKISK
ncbi:MAG TPA: acyl carrier protein [Candidatus Merdousia gallistercoris]|nr:acyl carrier protein [Candidatus Merdousia gallistercoris]